MCNGVERPTTTTDTEGLIYIRVRMKSSTVFYYSACEMLYSCGINRLCCCLEDAQNSIHFVINGGDGNEDVVVLRHSKGLCIVT